MIQKDKSIVTRKEIIRFFLWVVWDCTQCTKGVNWDLINPYSTSEGGEVGHTMWSREGSFSPRQKRETFFTSLFPLRIYQTEGDSSLLLSQKSVGVLRNSRVVLSTEVANEHRDDRYDKSPEPLHRTSTKHIQKLSLELDSYHTTLLVSVPTL